MITFLWSGVSAYTHHRTKAALVVCQSTEQRPDHPFILVQLYSKTWQPPRMYLLILLFKAIYYNADELSLLGTSITFGYIKSLFTLDGSLVAVQRNYKETDCGVFLTWCFWHSCEREQFRYPLFKKKENSSWYFWSWIDKMRHVKELSTCVGRQLGMR